MDYEDNYTRPISRPYRALLLIDIPHEGALEISGVVNGGTSEENG